MADEHAAEFRISLGSVGEFTQDERGSLESIVVEDHVDKIAVCRLTFSINNASDGSSGGIDWSGVNSGDDVTVRLGAIDELFVGVVTGRRVHGIGGNIRLTVTAMDPLCKMAATSFTKVFSAGDTSTTATDGSHVTWAIGKAGCTSGTVEDGGRTVYTLMRNESCLNFCKRMAARNGFWLRSRAGKIDFIQPEFEDPSGNFAAGVPFDELVQVDFTLSDLTIPAKVETIGWDYVAKDLVKGEKASSAVDKIGGGAAANSAFFTTPSYVVDVMVNTAASATKMAEAQMNAMSRRGLMGRVRVGGVGHVRAGTKLKLLGVAKDFNIEALVVGTRQVIEPHGGVYSDFHFVGNTDPL